MDSITHVAYPRTWEAGSAHVRRATRRDSWTGSSYLTRDREYAIGEKQMTTHLTTKSGFHPIPTHASGPRANRTLAFYLSFSSIASIRCLNFENVSACKSHSLLPCQSRCRHSFYHPTRSNRLDSPFYIISKTPLRVPPCPRIPPHVKRPRLILNAPPLAHPKHQ